VLCANNEHDDISKSLIEFMNDTSGNLKSVFLGDYKKENSRLVLSGFGEGLIDFPKVKT